MRIKYIAWKRVTCGDAQRILYKIIGGKDNSKDHAIQAFCSKDHANPGLWTGFTNGQPAPQRSKRGNESFPIKIENSKYPLEIWLDNNASRNSPIKIAQRIWNSKNPEDVVETWYIAYMRIIKQLLERIIKAGRGTADAETLLSFIEGRLAILPEENAKIASWINSTQDMFCGLSLNTKEFLEDSVIKDLKDFIDNYYYIVFKYVDVDGAEKNETVVANITAPKLHPVIRNILAKGEKGGEFIDLVIAGDTTDKDASEIINKLYLEKNIILYGAPGTGKTHLLTQIMEAFSKETSYNALDSEAPIAIEGESGKCSNVKWCTFHPDYSYENFVWGISPVIVNKKLGYTYHKGPFLELAVESMKGAKTLLIVDEINRANTDDVFGDTIRLLDKRKRGKVRIPVPEQVNVDGNNMMCTENFYVIGTMNSLDKSVSPLTPELKRIFSIVEVKPDEKALREAMEKTEIPTDFINLVLTIFHGLNEALYENVGKEYMFGQGYFWDLVNMPMNYEGTLADILRNKVMPHLKDIYPEEKYLDLFKPVNHELLFIQHEDFSEICNITNLSNGKLIDAFAKMFDTSYSFEEKEDVVYTNFEEYEKKRNDEIYERLVKYKNLILSGVSGTGKSSILESLKNDYDFEEQEIMYWHNSTAYSDVIEGIGTRINEDGDDIEYTYNAGAVKRLAEYAKNRKSLMEIENLDKSKASENFGELITLLEPDKREKVSIEGAQNAIVLPKDMHFLCTMNSVAMAKNKMDSAMKRRFLIMEIYPDYTLLSLWFGVTNAIGDYLIDWDTKQGRLKLAIELLRALNKRIILTIGMDAQIGHAIMWDLKETEQCDVEDIGKVFDETIIPMIEDYCVDSEMAHRLLGNNSPIVINRSYGAELLKINEMSDEDKKKTFEELIYGEI